MSVRLRLRRMGRKKKPFYRIVAADQRSPRDGRFIEIIGHYDPLQNPQTIDLKEDRIHYWLTRGAQPTSTVRSLLRKKGLWHRLEMEKQGLEPDKIEEEMKKWELLQIERSKRRESEKVKKVKEKEASKDAEKAEKETTEAPKVAAAAPAEIAESDSEAVEETGKAEAVVEVESEAAEAVAEVASEATEEVEEKQAEEVKTEEPQPEIVEETVQEEPVKDSPLEEETKIKAEQGKKINVGDESTPAADKADETDSKDEK